MTLAPQQLAVVTIGYDSYLLPMSQAARVVEIIGRAEIVKRDYVAARDVWHLQKEPIIASLKSVRADQIKATPISSSKPAALEHIRRADA